jgi:hypothetical protein
LFNINGEEWYINFVPLLHPKLFRSDGTSSIGSCDDYTKTIYLYEELYGNLLQKVLCHEIVHAAMFSYNIELTID